MFVVFDGITGDKNQTAKIAVDSKNVNVIEPAYIDGKDQPNISVITLGVQVRVQVKGSVQEVLQRLTNEDWTSEFKQKKRVGRNVKSGSSRPK